MIRLARSTAESRFAAAAEELASGAPLADSPPPQAVIKIANKQAAGTRIAPPIRLFSYRQGTLN